MTTFDLHCLEKIYSFDKTKHIVVNPTISKTHYFNRKTKLSKHSINTDTTSLHRRTNPLWITTEVLTRASSTWPAGSWRYSENPVISFENKSSL